MNNNTDACSSPFMKNYVPVTVLGFYSWEETLSLSLLGTERQQLALE